jgi:PEP-CTERM/exosortase A-associated glycosyltransferase
MCFLRRRISEVIAAEKPDIVQAHSPVLVGLPALWAARKAGIPLVYEVRGLWEDAAVDLGHCREGDLRYRISRGLETYLLRRADGVATLCQSMRAELAGRGIDAARIAVVPNAVDVDRFRPTAAKDDALLAELGLQGRRLLGFIGSFYHYEGIDLLLDALPAIRARHPDVALLLVGGGPMEAELKAQVARLGLQDVVRFTGRVPHEQVGRYYDLVDLLVFARKRIRLTELVTPLKPIEAMAEGRVVLASDVGGHREQIVDGQNGFLFAADSVDALAEKVGDVLALPDLSAIRATAQDFVRRERTWPASAAAYRALYGRALGRQGRHVSPENPERELSP